MANKNENDMDELFSSSELNDMDGLEDLNFSDTLDEEFPMGDLEDLGDLDDIGDLSDISEDINMDHLDDAMLFSENLEQDVRASEEVLPEDLAEDIEDQMVNTLEGEPMDPELLDLIQEDKEDSVEKEMLEEEEKEQRKEPEKREDSNQDSEEEERNSEIKNPEEESEIQNPVEFDMPQTDEPEQNELEQINDTKAEEIEAEYDRGAEESQMEEKNVSAKEPKEEEVVKADSKENQEKDTPTEDNILNSLMEETQDFDMEEPKELDSLEQTLKEESEPEESSEDILALEDTIEFKEEENAEKTEDTISDLGDIFSESLGALGMDEEAKDSEGNTQESDLEEETKQKSGWKAFFAKIFGNLNDEKAQKKREKELQEELEKQQLKEEKKLAKAKEKGVDAEGNPLSKEELKKRKEEEKEQKKKEKQEIKEQKKKEKLEKKEEKKKEKEAEIEEEPPGRINPIGASIVIVFFALLTAVILVGTNLFSYQQSVGKASDLFEKQKYNKAYEEIRGLKIKKKDQELFDKIETVMYVNKQLNSYHNYYSLKMFPEALDSLLKGLERYDKYLEKAKELGVSADYKIMKNQILQELKSTFGISEKKAYAILKIESQEKYSKKVVEAAKLK